MTPAEIDVPHALVRVLEEAGIEFVFGMPGGDTGRIFVVLDVVTTEHAPFWQVQSPLAKEGPGGE